MSMLSTSVLSNPVLEAVMAKAVKDGGIYRNINNGRFAASQGRLDRLGHLTQFVGAKAARHKARRAG